MGDIAQILAPTAAAARNVVPATSKPGASASIDSMKAVEMAGMSKEAMYLLKGKQETASASLPPVFPTLAKISGTNGALPERKTPGYNKDGSAAVSANKCGEEQQEVKVKVGSKTISSTKRARPWTWALFASSSRTDGAMFRHWVRKNVEYTDYPYAKFDVHMDPVTYTSEEYAAHLHSDTWTRSETDRLMELTRIFECRWPIIFDRFCFENSNNASATNHANEKKGTGTTVTSNSGTGFATGNIYTRKIEDLQHRYYGVAATLAQLRIAQEAASEARALSAAAAKSASAATSTTASSKTAPGTTAAPNSTDGISPVAAQQEKTETLLLESAAARSLATSAKQHQPLITHVGTGTSNKMFDISRERERRHHLDRLWRRSKEEEEEEVQLRKELKMIDAQLRKLKKHGGHILAAGTTKATGKTQSVVSTAASRPMLTQPNGLTKKFSSAPPSRVPSRSATPVSQGASSLIVPRDGVNNSGNNSNNDIVENSDVLDEYFASTAPVPMSQYPYLQSGRLVPPATGGSSGINKSILTRMDEVLGELNIPNRPIPTKRVCDLYDLVRKDTLTLLTLKKMLIQREGQLQSKRLRLSRMGGSLLAPEDKILDEERLLGIAPPPKPASSTAAGNSTSAASKTKTTKRKPTSSVGAKSKATAKKGSVDAKTVVGTTTKKKTVKRKRKAEPGKSSNPSLSNISSKPLVPGSSAPAKAASKVRTTSATSGGGSAVPKLTAAPRATSIANASALPKSGGQAASSIILPKSSPQVTAIPGVKAPTAAITTTTALGDNKPNNGNTLKRARKS